MTNSTTPEINPTPPGDASEVRPPIVPRHSDDLFTDPDFAQLHEYFQRAQFSQCYRLLDQLDAYYPDHPTLLKFRDELELKLSVTDMTSTIHEAEKRYKRKATFNLGLFAVIAVVVIVGAFFLSLRYFISQGAVELEPTPIVENTGPHQQLVRLFNQAEGLLLTGRPRPAAGIIDQIRDADPDFPDLDDLSARAEALLVLEAQYEAALDLAAEGRAAEALEIFHDIEDEQPGLWDVRRQISAIEKEIQIAQYLEEANTAFEAQNWAGVISAYEGAISLDYRLTDNVKKEQLLRSYLNQILIMLEDQDTTIEDIELAEGYYRKATALFPQSREFTSERGNLQELTSNLLEIKFAQIAMSNLESRYQTRGSVAQAVAYHRKAANLKPRNTTLQEDLRTAELYQAGFQNFVDLNWVGAVNNLKQVIEIDRDYANGNAGILLYEAYYAIGRQYYAAALFPDALSNLEQAEFLAWDRLENLTQLFQIQVLLGHTYGKTGAYQDAVSYYQYALNAIGASTKVPFGSAQAALLSNANVAAANGDYESAYDIYRGVIDELEVIYTTTEVEIGDSAILALFAHDNLSTLDAVLRANNLPREMLISFGRTLQVPMIEK